VEVVGPVEQAVLADVERDALGDAGAVADEADVLVVEVGQMVRAQGAGRW
jgi:hypothetical protein